MSYVLGWCLAVGILTPVLVRFLKRAPYHRVPPDAKRFFLRLEEELKERHPGVQLVGLTSEGFGAVLRVERQEIPVPLGEVFLRERAFPSAFPHTVDRLVNEVRAYLAAVDDLPFDEAVQAVLPQVRSMEWVRHNSPAFGPGRILTTPLLDDLATLYVIDEPGSMVFVTEGHLEAWGTRGDFIENIAKSNLRRLAEEAGSFPIPDAGEDEPCVLHTGDGYDAARILLAMDESRVDDVKGLVFGIPDRDTLVVGRKDSDLVSLMGEVGDEFGRGDHPISPRLFEVGDRALQPVDVGG